MCERETTTMNLTSSLLLLLARPARGSKEAGCPRSQLVRFGVLGPGGAAPCGHRVARQDDVAFAAAARAQSRNTPGPRAKAAAASAYREHKPDRGSNRKCIAEIDAHDAHGTRMQAHIGGRKDRRRAAPRELCALIHSAAGPPFSFPVNAAIIADIPKGERSRSRRRRHRRHSTVITV